VAEWTAEVTVDEELARRLIREQFPDLAARSARLLAESWDNTVWLVDETRVFRFPRREIAVPLVERDLAVLPHLESTLPRVFAFSNLLRVGAVRRILPIRAHGDQRRLRPDLDLGSASGPEPESSLIPRRSRKRIIRHPERPFSRRT
jgi:hypothetical protein